MVAFVTCLIIGFVCIGVVVFVGTRRDPNATLTWGEAMVAGTFAFFTFFWFYGVIPHQWLTWADNQLVWRSDKLLVGPGGILEVSNWQPWTLSYKIIRDIIAATLYIVFLGAHIAMWAWWNDRRKPKAAVVPTSRYGRPLVKG